MEKKDVYNYILSIADNSLILGQRMGELCGHGPNLEPDIACTNIALDLLGQTRSYYQYAGKLSAKSTESEDTIAFLRKEHEYRNSLLVEQPNIDFAHVMAKLFLFSTFYVDFLEALSKSIDLQLRAIAKKSIKEVKYHCAISSDWVIRLGDGTNNSHKRMQDAIDTLWLYTNELFEETELDRRAIKHGIGVDVAALREGYLKKVGDVLQEATLDVPEDSWYQSGGKKGIHSEHMGYILSDMQYMQRTYPNMKW